MQLLKIYDTNYNPMGLLLALADGLRLLGSEIGGGTMNNLLHYLPKNFLVEDNIGLLVVVCVIAAVVVYKAIDWTLERLIP